VDPKELAIFIVDDDESVLRSLRRLLRSSGFHRIKTFLSAEDFLHRAVPEKPCLLILDLLLPDMSGIELYRRLQELGRPMETIFISALEQEMKKARQAYPDAAAFLVKPFEQGDLLAAVRSIPGDSPEP
jgi:FixJ family two-component response regulator